MAASSGPSQAFVQLTSPEEGNWLSLGRALTSVLCQGLRPYIKREMAIFYSNVTAAITRSRAGPCTCVYDPIPRCEQVCMGNISPKRTPGKQTKLEAK